MAAADSNYVLRVPVIRDCISLLLSRDTHQFFPAYLHLRRRAAQTGSLAGLSPVWGEVHSWLAVPGGPFGKPHLRPFWEGKRSAGQEWLGPNLAGSYSPSSLRRSPQEVIDTDDEGRFILRPKHWELARKYLLHDEPIPVLALAGFLFRNFAIVSDEALAPAALVQIFREYIGYRVPEDGEEFDYLYDIGQPFDTENWFQPLTEYQAEIEDAVQA